jgi:hypothetical protein
VDLGQEATFILWGSEMVHMRKNTHRYYNGINSFMRQLELKEVYMVSTSDSSVLYQIDPKLFTDLKVDLIEKRTGAIEKWSNLYLYRIHIP